MATLLVLFTLAGCTSPKLDCPAGTQDNDGSGDCSADCAQTTCGTNAVCDDSSGTAACTCMSGMQDKDGDGDCSTDCAQITCGTNAVCDDSSGTAACTCMSGMQDKDGDGNCSTDCAHTTCGTNAVCDDSSGTAACACTNGTQDKDGDDDCSADCSTITCGTNAVCDDASGTATCNCVAYVVDDHSTSAAGIGNYTWFGQSFRTESCAGGKLTSFSLWFEGTGNAVGHLFATANGMPTGSALATSVSIPFSSGGMAEVVFPLNATALTPDTTYAVIAHTDTGLIVNARGGDEFAGGNFLTSVDGVSWSVSPVADQYFKAVIAP